MSKFYDSTNLLHVLLVAIQRNTQGVRTRLAEVETGPLAPLTECLVVDYQDKYVFVTHSEAMGFVLLPLLRFNPVPEPGELPVEAYHTGQAALGAIFAYLGVPWPPGTVN